MSAGRIKEIDYLRQYEKLIGRTEKERKFVLEVIERVRKYNEIKLRKDKTKTIIVD